MLLLGQELSWLEILGIALVIVASIGAVRSASKAARSTDAAATAAVDEKVGEPGPELDEPFAEPMA